MDSKSTNEMLIKLFQSMYPLNHLVHPKSVVSSEASRLAGNDAFKSWDFKHALLFYNASLCAAPPGSKDIALAYGNRSAVYSEMGKYALAIENIKLARENGFPTEKMAQLEAREEKCKKLMEEFGPDKNSEADSFFKLSHPPNEKIPFIADCLELRKNMKYGRGIYTTKDLNSGDIIAIERPAMSFTNQMVSALSCLFCTETKSGSLFPCSHCTSAMFCSEDCREKAALYHLNDEFNETYSNQAALKMLLDAFRVAGGVDEAIELLKDCEGKTIFEFDFSNPEDPNYEKNKLIALNGLWRNVGNREITEIKPEKYLNIPPINEKPRTAKERKQLLKFIISQFQIHASNTTILARSHNGICLFQSLINHACFPNVIGSKFGTHSVLMVSLPIKAGEQIFCSYGVRASGQAKSYRRATLLSLYQFECDCKACINNWPQQYPIKDYSFDVPTFKKVKREEAIEQFKKNCKYINENAEKMPCHEVFASISHNNFLTELIAGSEIGEE